MQIHNELDYGTMGLDFVGSGGQGGVFIAHGKMWEKRLIHSVWSLCTSFGFPYGCLCGFELLRAMHHGARVFPFTQQVFP